MLKRIPGAQAFPVGYPRTGFTTFGTRPGIVSLEKYPRPPRLGALVQCHPARPRPQQLEACFRHTTSSDSGLLRVRHSGCICTWSSTHPGLVRRPAGEVHHEGHQEGGGGASAHAWCGHAPAPSGAPRDVGQHSAGADADVAIEVGRYRAALGRYRFQNTGSQHYGRGRFPRRALGTISPSTETRFRGSF